MEAREPWQREKSGLHAPRLSAGQLLRRTQGSSRSALPRSSSSCSIALSQVQICSLPPEHCINSRQHALLGNIIREMAE